MFQLGASGVVVLQLRAPAVRKQEEALCDEVSRWAAGEGFAQALVLAAADATMRIDAQLKG